MTDAERLARAYVDARHKADGVTMWDQLFSDARQANIAAAQSVIDSGLVTVTPEPDPAEKIEAVFFRAIPGNRVEIFRQMLDDGIIAPGPNL